MSLVVDGQHVQRSPRSLADKRRAKVSLRPGFRKDRSSSQNSRYQEAHQLDIDEMGVPEVAYTEEYVECRPYERLLC